MKFGDDSRIAIHGRGKIHLNLKDGLPISLMNVLYTTSLRGNILSLGRLDEQGCKIHLEDGSLTIDDQSGKLLMRVQRNLGKTLFFEARCVGELSSSEGRNNVDMAKEVGHLNFASLKLLSSHDMVQGMPKLEKLVEFCGDWLRSKQT